MFEMENMNEEIGNLRVACIGKAATVWNKQTFSQKFKLLEGNPLEPSVWRKVDIGFLIADAEKEEDLKNIHKAVEAAEETCIPLLIPIVISAKSIEALETLEPFLIINPKNYTGEFELYTNIYYAIKSINDLVAVPGLVNLDIADVISIWQNKINFIFAMGEAKGENASMAAAKDAINKVAVLKGNGNSKGGDVLLNITGSEDNLSMYEIQEAAEFIHDWLDDEQSTIIWGAAIDNSLEDTIRVYILIGE